jgi:hypothetical protein
MGTFHLEILPQPDDETCGATCLHAIYKYYGETVDLPELITEVPRLETGGTLAVMLGINALLKGYKATIYTYNLRVFDPTWFRKGVDLAAKLKMQLEYKSQPKIQYATKAYLKYLRLGGEIRFHELNRPLLRKYLDKHIPVLTGLNATYLYRWSREFDNEFDDMRGTSMGHFVVLSGYNKKTRKVSISDPLLSNPFSNQAYEVKIDRVINSIMLGILTYDANFLVIEKQEQEKETEHDENSGSEQA